MTPDEKLMAMGAQPVGGTLFKDRVAMGRYGAAGFELTAAGEAALAAKKEPAPTKQSRPTKHAPRVVLDDEADGQ